MGWEGATDQTEVDTDLLREQILHLIRADCEDPRFPIYSDAGRVRKILCRNDLQPFYEKSSSWRFWGKHFVGSSVYTYWHLSYMRHLLTDL